MLPPHMCCTPHTPHLLVCSYNGTGLLVEVWSKCVAATLVNATTGRRLAASQTIGAVRLNIATYVRVQSLAAAQAIIAAYQADLTRCAAARKRGLQRHGAMRQLAVAVAEQTRAPRTQLEFAIE